MDIPAFEYMRFAKSASAGARISLMASGLGPPPIDWLGEPALLVNLKDAGVAGTLFLRERIAMRYGVAPAEVFVTPGASAAIHLVAGALALPGTRALAERPVYPPLFMEPRMFGSQIGYIERRVEEGFRLDPARARASLDLAPRASMLMFTNLHNPSGVRTSETDILEIGEAAARTGTRLVCCELYGDFLGPSRPSPVARLVPGAVSIGSLTKAFGLGAIRIGWIICKDKDLLERADRFFDHIDVNCPMPSLQIAAAAFDKMEWLEHRAQAISEAGKAVFMEWAAAESARKRVRAVEPDGGIIAFPLLYRVTDTIEFARRLRERTGVQVTPGEYFLSPGHIRVGFGSDSAKVKEGLAAVSQELGRAGA